MGDEIGQRGSSRIHASLSVSREVVERDHPELYEFGSFRLEPAERKLTRGNEVVVLTPKAFDTLVLLVRNSGHLLEKDELIRILWPDSFVEEGNLSNNIFLLRKALGDDPPYIETVPKRGYRFVGAVRRLPNAVPILPENSPEEAREFAKQVSTDRGFSSGKSVLGRSILAGVAGLLLVCVVIIWHSQPRPPTVTAIARVTNDGKAKNSMNPFVTDGVRLYFIEGVPWTTGPQIAQVSATGGETTWMTTTLRKAVAIFDISPDRSELLVANLPAEGADTTGLSDPSAELWVQPLPAGAPHRVGNFYASAATWTPDGMHIVYAAGREIMIANKDGSEHHLLAKVSGVVQLLRFSPDGLQIRFSLTQRHAETDSIWEMDASGKNIHPLFPDWKDSTQCCGDWSPGGDFYYFQATRDGTQAIWALPERRSIFRWPAKNASPLTSGPLRFSDPIPSGDGKKLFVIGEESRVELFRYNLPARRFESYLPGLSAGPVDFSPDRKWMAYVSYPDGTLWRSRVDGSDKMQLTFPPVRAYEPRWSPDGSTIAFMDVQLSHPWKIRLVSSQGGSPELLVKEGDREPEEEPEEDPTWTPDGKSIVFARSDGTTHFAIYRLDFNTRKMSPIPDSKGLMSPRVSPDGRYVCALSYPDTKLMLFDTSTNRWSSLVEGKELSYNEWSHDGKYVYMRESREGAGEMVRVRIKDRALQDVVNLKDFPQLDDIFAGWIGLTPDDSPLLMRDRSVQEIYALDLSFH